MRWSGWCAFVGAVLFQLHGEAGDARAAPSSGAKSSPVTYEIRKELVPGKELLTKFKAVSSHGRDDGAVGGGDGSALATYAPWQVALRASYLLLLFAPVFMTSGLAYISTVYRNVVWFSLLRFGISHGGAAFIKWAQWASTRPDIFPEELCSVLASLQSGAPAHSLAFTKRQIKKELGAPLEQVFEYFSPRPIASGSIAQVYKARLNGQDVAVKVRHPHVEEHIALDFIIMKAVAGLVDLLPGLDWLKLSETMSQFSSTIASQTKLDIEGRHLYLFNHYFRQWRGVTFPKPIILTESVLVESYEHGESVAHYTETLSDRGQSAAGEASVDDTARSRTDLAHFIVTTGEDTYLKMLLQDNLMHADLHPGNILIQPYVRGMGVGDADAAAQRVVAAGAAPVAAVGSGSSRAVAVEMAARAAELKTRIVLVDAGMVARLVPEEQRNFIGLIEAMGEGRGEEAADHVMRFTAAPAYDAQTRVSFRRGMKELFDVDCRGYGHNVNIGRALRGILNLVRVNKITIDANYATLVMNCLCLDSLAASLSPTYNILDGAKPLLRFHRACKRIPGARMFMRAAIPVARWLKRQSDRLFLVQLQRKQQKQ